MTGRWRAGGSSLFDSAAIAATIPGNQTSIGLMVRSTRSVRLEPWPPILRDAPAALLRMRAEVGHAGGSNHAETCITRSRGCPHSVSRLGAVLQGQDAHAAGELRGRRQCRYRGARLPAASLPAHPRQSQRHHPQPAGRRRRQCDEPARSRHRRPAGRAHARLLHDERDLVDHRRSGAQGEDPGRLRADRRRPRLERGLCPQGHRPRRLYEARRLPEGAEDFRRRLQQGDVA